MSPDDVEPGATRVERGLFYAVIERQPGDVDGVDPLVAQQPLEVGVLEARVPLVVGLAPRVDNGVDLARM